MLGSWVSPIERSRRPGADGGNTHTGLPVQIRYCLEVPSTHQRQGIPVFNFVKINTSCRHRRPYGLGFVSRKIELTRKCGPVNSRRYQSDLESRIIKDFGESTSWPPSLVEYGGR